MYLTISKNASLRISLFTPEQPSINKCLKHHHAKTELLHLQKYKEKWK